MKVTLDRLLFQTSGFFIIYILISFNIIYLDIKNYLKKMIFVSLIFFISNLCLFYFHDNLNKINYPVDHPNKRKIHSKKNFIIWRIIFL